MPLEQIIIPTATRTSVRLTGSPVPHPTAGYRLWRGTFESVEPIVALAITVCGRHVHWARTSHRSTPSLETSILFSPYDEAGLDIAVTFSIFDAVATSQVITDSRQSQPTPSPKTFVTGQLVEVADFATDPPCRLNALFLIRRDVASVRNGVWHAKSEVVSSMGDPWRKMLTYGRAGELETE